MSELIQRAELLMQQERYAEAEKELKQALSQAPNDYYTLALLAEVSLELDRYDNARMLIDSAIGLNPATAYLLYVRARVFALQDDYNGAEREIAQAVSLEPDDADYYAWWANIKLARKMYTEALELADKALSLDPANLLALNMRSRALVKTNQYEASFETIEGALREDPDNSFTHSNYGWNLLEQGNHQKAKEHFREALRSDPSNEDAQSGMLEALKADNLLYRMFQKYAFWMGNLSGKYQWGVILGFYFGTQLIKNLAKQNEALQPFLLPVVVLLALFAFSTWIVGPVGNLLLRINPFGKHLLNRKEIISSNFVGVCALVCITGLVTYFVTLHQPLLSVAAFGFAMMLPCSSMLSPAKNPVILKMLAGVLTVFGLLAILMSFASGNLFNGISLLFIIQFVAYQFISNFILIKEDNK